MKTLNFDRGWDFSYSTGNAFLDAKGEAYREIVDLPHDFMINTARVPDSRTEGAGGFFQGGVGTYEKRFSISGEKKGKGFCFLSRGAMETQRYGSTGTSRNCIIMGTRNFMWTLRSGCFMRKRIN